MGAFRCTRCGHCCSNLFATTPEGHTFGLYLEPSEIKRFPGEVVSPLFGRGPIETVTVTAYQLNVNRCPLVSFVDGRAACGIYERRPLTCVAFPILSHAKVTPACPAVRANPDGIDSSSVASELAAHREKLRLMVERPLDDWVWPLDKRRWIPLRS